MLGIKSLLSQNPWEIAVSRVSLIPIFKQFPTGEFSIQIVRKADDFSSKFNLNTWTDYLDDKEIGNIDFTYQQDNTCLLYTSPSPRDRQKSRMPSSA